MMQILQLNNALIKWHRAHHQFQSNIMSLFGTFAYRTFRNSTFVCVTILALIRAPLLSENLTNVHELRYCSTPVTFEIAFHFAPWARESKYV